MAGGRILPAGVVNTRTVGQVRAETFVRDVGTDEASPFRQREVAIGNRARAGLPRDGQDIATN